MMTSVSTVTPRTFDSIFVGEFCNSCTTFYIKIAPIMAVHHNHNIILNAVMMVLNPTNKIISTRLTCLNGGASVTPCDDVFIGRHFYVIPDPPMQEVELSVLHLRGEVFVRYTKKLRNRVYLEMDEGTLYETPRKQKIRYVALSGIRHRSRF